MTHLLQNLFLHLIFIFVVYKTPSEARIDISDGAKRTFWNGCILRKKPLDSDDFESEEGMASDACFNCTRARDPTLVVRRKGIPQRMYDCTKYCRRKTLCTHARYSDGRSNQTYPLCYQCLQKNYEIVRFSRLTQKELCIPGCLDCARTMDLAKSTDCLEECRGLPTFCYPKQLIMHQYNCYQADAYFGCDQDTYTVVTDGNITNIPPNTTAVAMSQSCSDCALKARSLEKGRECAYDCSGIPTWSNNLWPNRTELQMKLQFWGCKRFPKVMHGEIFMYDVPKHMLKWFHVSNPGNLYGVENVQRSDSLGGAIAVFIHTFFNMTFLTFPRPKGFEDTKMT